VGDLHSRLVLERVGGELGGLDLGVDGVAVRAGDGGGVALRGEAGAQDGRPPIAAALHRRAQRRVEVDVHALVAGRVRVGEVCGERRLTLGRSAYGALERELGGVEQHWTSSLRREDFVRPWTALAAGPWRLAGLIGPAPESFRRGSSSRPALGAQSGVARLGGARDRAVAVHRALAAAERRQLARDLVAGEGELADQLVLHGGDALEDG